MEKTPLSLLQRKKNVYLDSKTENITLSNKKTCPKQKPFTNKQTKRNKKTKEEEATFNSQICSQVAEPISKSSTFLDDLNTKTFSVILRKKTKLLKKERNKRRKRKKMLQKCY